MKKLTPLFLLCLASTCLGGSLDISEFESPANAPIYVIDGDIDYNDTLNGLSVSLGWSSNMNETTGALTGSGDFTINGNVNSLAIDWAGTIGANMNVKVAGSVVRANGKMTMSGSGTIAGYTLDSLSLVYTFLNFDVNPATGQMAGYVSLKGTASLLGRTVPLSLPKTNLAMDLPDVDMNGQWDSAGDWKISDIVASVDGKGKVVGTGNFKFKCFEINCALIYVFKSLIFSASSIFVLFVFQSRSIFLYLAFVTEEKFFIFPKSFNLFFILFGVNKEDSNKIT